MSSNTTTIKKSRLVAEDIHFDITGENETVQIPTSTGGSRTGHKVNANHMPVTAATTTASPAGNKLVDAILQEIFAELLLRLKADGSVAMASALNMASNKITNLANGTASGDALHVGQVDDTTIELSSDTLSVKANSITSAFLATLLDTVDSEIVNMTTQSSIPDDNAQRNILYVYNDGTKDQLYFKRKDGTISKLPEQSAAFNTPDFESAWITVSSGTGWQDVTHNLGTTNIAIIKISVRQNSGANNAEFVMYPGMTTRGKQSEYENRGISLKVKDANNLSLFPAGGNTQNWVAYFLGASSVGTGQWTADAVSSAQFKFQIWTHN